MKSTGRFILLLFALTALSLLWPAPGVAQEPPRRAVADIDTVADSVAIADTLRADSMAAPPARRERFVKRQVDLDNAVAFSAGDSIVLYGKSHARMFGDGKIKYGDIDLSAEQITMNMDSSQVHAVGVLDSIGEPTGTPVFKDGSGEYKSQRMSYNFKTKKGYITGIVTEQGEGYLTGGVTKKMEDNQYYIKDGRYTTCDNHDHPHFYFQLTKAKVRPKKNVVPGPAYMVLEDLPLPLAVPFGYFPFSEKYQSGILMPTVGEDYNRGFYLRNGGY